MTGQVDAKWIPGYEGIYQVTRNGDVVSHKRRQPRRLESCQGKVSLYKDGIKRQRLVSHLVLNAFVAERPSANHHAWHVNGDRNDCRVDNLHWGIYQDRILDMRDRGTLGSKLSVNDVEGIRELYKDGYSAKEIASAVDICPNHVYRICHRRMWKCVV